MYVFFEDAKSEEIEILIRLFLPLPVFAVIGLIFFSRKKNPGEKFFSKSNFVFLFLTFWILFWCVIHISWLISLHSQITEFTEKYYGLSYGVAEGEVQVLRRQTREREPAEQAEINGKVFEINAYTANAPYYKKTITKGGFLKQGAYVRVHFTGDKIIEVFVKR